MYMTFLRQRKVYTTHTNPKKIICGSMLGKQQQGQSLCFYTDLRYIYVKS